MMLLMRLASDSLGHSAASARGQLALARRHDLNGLPNPLPPLPPQRGRDGWVHTNLSQTCGGKNKHGTVQEHTSRKASHAQY